MKHVITDEMITSISTPRFSVMVFQPSRKLSMKLPDRSGLFVIMLFLTTPIHITVRKNVQISITISSFTSATVSSMPAMSGEIRYLALPEMLTIPLAFEYSSLVRRSVTVALYEGSSNDENTELINTPMQI